MLRRSAVIHLKRLVRALSPPLLLFAAKGIRNLFRPAPPPEWEYVPEGWERAKLDPRIRGWNVTSILDAYKENWPSFVKAVEQKGPLGISYETPTGVPVTTTHFTAHTALVSYAYVLCLATRKQEGISILDWGGGIGHYYLISQAVVPHVRISYHCKDMPVLCTYGRELFEDAIFYDDDTCFERKYDLVLASGSLQYSEDWPETLAKLASVAKNYLYVTRLPIVHRSPSFVVVHRPYAYGYNTELLGWVLKREDFIQRATEQDMELVREFLTREPFTAQSAPEVLETRGFLFRPRRRPQASSRG